MERALDRQVPYVLLCVCVTVISLVSRVSVLPCGQATGQMAGLSAISAKLQLERESPESTLPEGQWGLHKAAAHTPHAQSDTQDTKGTLRHTYSCQLRNKELKSYTEKDAKSDPL